MNKTIFAFDFDNTIMFSKINSDMHDEIYMCSDGYGYLYTTQKAIELFNILIQKRVPLVLITARHYEQLKDLDFLNKVNIKYIIASLGYKIYVDGIEDIEWSNRCYKEGLKLCKNNVNKVVRKILEDNIKKVKLISDGYIYVLLKNNKNEKQIPTLKRELKILGYELFVCNNTIKIISICTNKGSAFEFFKNKYFEQGIDEIIAAGDDLIDISFLQKSTNAIIPANSKLKDYFHDYIVTKRKGVYCTQEILELVMDSIK